MLTNTVIANSPCHTGKRRWQVAAVITIVLTCCAVYANSLAVPFVFDDSGAILENTSIRHLTKLKRVFLPPREGRTVEGRPVLNFSFALNYAWTKFDVWSWHVVNIGIHALAGVCLFGVSRQTLLSGRFADRERDRATFLAFAIALVWTLHPLQTESVTYIVQRAESLAGLMFLLTLYCSIRAVHSPPGRTWQSAAVVSCAVGMASKEVMVGAPLLIVLYDWAFSEDSLRAVVKRRWRFYTCLAGTWIVLGVLLFGSHNRGGSAGLGQGVTSWEYACTQFGFIVHYLRLSFWPHPLVLDYGDQIATQPGEIISAALLVLALAGGTMAALIRPAWRPLGFLGAWFFCILAPSSSVVPVITQTGAEHRMYLPLAAVVALIVIAADRFLSATVLGDRRSRPGRAETNASILEPSVPHSRVPALVGPVLLGVVAVVLGVVTARRNFDYRTVVSIWSDVAEKCPENYRALNNMGEATVAAGDFLRGIEFYDQSIRLNPRIAGSYNLRGDAYMKLGRIDEARRDFQQARDVVPRKAAPHFDLGVACASTGDLEGALAAFTRAEKLAPSSAPVRWHRGVALARLARHAEAIDELSEALRLDRDFTDAYRERALSYLELERYDLARADLEEMQRLGFPADPQLVKRFEKESDAERPRP